MTTTSQEACCTCASLLSPPPSSTTPSISLLTEKPTTITPTTTAATTPHTPPRRLPCCSRAICASCLTSNPRFETYCPFCQVSSEPTPLPQGLRDPPAYSSAPSSPQRRGVDVSKSHLDFDPEEDKEAQQLPPPYSTRDAQEATLGHQGSKPTQPQEEDTIHHLHPTDTISSLSLAYRVPAPILRTHNLLFSDALLPARRTLLIPRSHYTGPSLAPSPVESEEESERKAAIRRFMVGAKVHEYEVAELYLGQAGGDVEGALERWREDERWERENPFEGRGKGKGKESGKRRGTGGGLVGQLR